MADQNREEQIQSALEEVGKKHEEEMKEAVDKLMENIFQKGMLPKDAMGISDSMMEGIYGHAYRLYNTGKYLEASRLFSLLIMLNPMTVKYIMGLAACSHMSKNYDQAASAYAMATVADPKNPLPFYHSSDCYLKMDMPAAAEIALETTIKLAENNPKYAVMKDRATFTLEGLRHREESKGAKAKNDVQQGGDKVVSLNNGE